MMTIGKIPPQAIEIEEAVLGSLMLFRESQDYASINLKPEMFYKDANQKVYKAIETLYKLNKGIDMLTVTEQLRKTNELEDCGGPYYVTKLTDNCYGNFAEWCLILKQKYTRREAIRIGNELMQTGYDDLNDELQGYETIDAAHKTLSDLLFGTSNLTDFHTVAQQAYQELIERMTRAHSNELPGMDTGLNELNALTGGWSKGDLIVLAGRPGMGKTAVALHFAISAAKAGKWVYMFSLEMTNTRLADRIIVGQTQVDNYCYKTGRLHDTQISFVQSWVENSSGLPIYFDEKSFVSVDYILSNCRMRKRKYELDIVIIDYLQLIDIEVSKGGTKDQAIGTVTRKLKSMAKELEVPVILLSQLNRKVEDRGDKMPQLSDLRESGNIEQDADIVMFCYRPAYYNIEEFNKQSTHEMMVLDVAKHRNGEANINIFARHNDSLTRFSNWNELNF